MVTRLPDLQQIDPEWAWSPYEPTPEAPWNVQRAAHLFRRAAFGATMAELEIAAAGTPAEAVASLVQASDSAASEAQANQLAQAMINTGEVRRLAAVWLHRMLATQAPLNERLTLFWHGHFATSGEKVTDARLMWNQHIMLRSLAQGPFAELVQRISTDPAMMIYLDSDTNRKSHPNENFARELLELFCLGEGNYTERDIRELARCFTGWQIKRGKFSVNQRQHDTGLKTLFGHTGDLDGTAAVPLVTSHPAAARFIATKLVRYFVMDEPTLSAQLVEPLARDFGENGFRVGPVVARILGSQIFFSHFSVGRKVRSPVDLACGLLRCTEGSVNTLQLAEGLETLGQGLFFPPNVKGWEGGRTWINSATLLGRANLIYDLIHAESTRFAGGTLGELIAAHELESMSEFLDWLSILLLAHPLDPSRSQQLLAVVTPEAGDIDQQANRLLHGLASMPEFQLA